MDWFGPSLISHFDNSTPSASSRRSILPLFSDIYNTLDPEYLSLHDLVDGRKDPD